MRTLTWLTAVALTAAPGPAPAAEPDALLRDIEKKWDGKVARDPSHPKRPVVEIMFHCTSAVPDAVIGQLAAFPELRKLGLIGGQSLTDAGLGHVGKLTTLEALDLRNNDVTADGLKQLANLPKLKTLFLWDVALTKENAAALEGLPALETLKLRTVTVSPEALASMKKLPRLKQIDGFRCDGAFASEPAVQAAVPAVKIRLTD